MERTPCGERTECPGSTKVLSNTLSVVNRTEAAVIAPKPTNAADETVCCPRGPRSIAMVQV